MDRLDAMRVFVTVAELRGFAPAARRLAISPSVATRLVAALETRLGTRLLQRTTRNVALTDAGRRYLERARHIIADVADAEREANDERATPRGHFVVGAPQLFGRLHVAPLLQRFLAHHPAVTGELRLADRVVNLVDEGIDTALRIGVLDDATPALVARKLGETRVVVVASPRYLRNSAPLRQPRDLKQHAILHIRSSDQSPEWQFTDERVAFSPRFTTNSNDAAIELALRGSGVARVLAYQVGAFVRANKLRIVLAHHEPPSLPIQIVYPSTRLLSANVRTFIDLAASTAAVHWRFV